MMMRAEDMDRDAEGHLTEKGLAQFVNWSIEAGLLDDEPTEIEED